MVTEGSKMVEDAKRNYFLRVGKALANPDTCSKTYWSLINTVLNKAKVPLIPPILENGIFITEFTEKAQLFNDYFILQCTTIGADSEIPGDSPVNVPLRNDFIISEDRILNIIRSLNPNKAHGWDDISVRMIKLSDAALVIPLKIIFTNCLRSGLFPQVWKYANVVPVHKKNEKNLKGNYRPISLPPVFGKIFEKIIYDSLYSHLVLCELLNPNQSGFRPARMENLGNSREEGWQFYQPFPGIQEPGIGIKIPGMAGRQPDFSCLGWKKIYSIPVVFRPGKTLENTGKA